MVEANEKGRKARRYFITCEEKLKEAALLQNEKIMQIVQGHGDTLLQIAHDKNISDQRIKIVEANLPSYQEKCFTVEAYCRLNNTLLDPISMAELELKCVRMRNRRGYMPLSICDPLRGKVKAFHVDVLERVVFD